MRALVAGRSHDAAARVPILYGGVKPDNCSVSPSPMSTVRSSAARASTPDGFARIVASAALSAPSVCLVVLDGWGLAEAGPERRRGARHDTPVFDELWERHFHTRR